MLYAMDISYEICTWFHCDFSTWCTCFYSSCLLNWHSGPSVRKLILKDMGKIKTQKVQTMCIIPMMCCTTYTQKNKIISKCCWGWVGLWGFLWWASLTKGRPPRQKKEDHHGVSSGSSSTWFHPNTGLSSTQYEQIPIIFGVDFGWLLSFFRSITFWRVCG